MKAILIPIETYSSWNHTIFDGVIGYERMFKKLPEMIAVNEATARRLDMAMSTELIAKGMTTEAKVFSTFAFSGGEVDVFIQAELPDDHFQLADEHPNENDDDNLPSKEATTPFLKALEEIK